jgi:hypothetical protein
MSAASAHIYTNPKEPLNELLNIDYLIDNKNITESNNSKLIMTDNLNEIDKYTKEITNTMIKLNNEIKGKKNKYNRISNNYNNKQITKIYIKEMTIINAYLFSLEHSEFMRINLPTNNFRITTLSNRFK